MLFDLVYTLRGFQPFADDFPEGCFHFIGPSVYERKEESFPILKKPVIYISIGTVLKGSKDFFRACMDAFGKEPVTVVLAVGNFEIAKLGRIPPNFLVRNGVPQITVLKQANLFLTHGGMNSVSEAMAQGVPMVVIPFVSDQPVNAERVACLGLGKVLDYRAVTPQSLKEAAFSVLSHEKIQENLRSMREQIAQAPGNLGAVRIIEEYALRKES